MGAYAIIKNLGQENITVLYESGILTDANIASLNIYARYEEVIQTHTVMDTYDILSKEFDRSVPRIRAIIKNLR